MRPRITTRRKLRYCVVFSAKGEGRSDVLRISFRHPDPAVGAEFLNELANALMATPG
jgi:hypothetical protein